LNGTPIQASLFAFIRFIACIAVMHFRGYRDGVRTVLASATVLT
jgi:hypothetical protein